MSAAAIQSTIKRCVFGDTVRFASGTYNLTYNPSNPQGAAFNLNAGVTYLGPTSGSPAILSGTGGYFLMAAYVGTMGVTIRNLTFSGGGIYFGGAVSNVKVENNTFGNIDSTYGNWTTRAAIFIETSAADSDFSYNTFSNIGQTANGQYQDSNGAGGIDSYGLHNTTIEHNTFDRVDEGISINFDNSDGFGVKIEYNTFTQWHRIAIETLACNASGLEIAYNNVSNALNPWALTFGLSMTCGSGALVHDNIVNANVRPSCSASYCYVPYGIEIAGNNTHAYNNVVEGYWEWGFAIGNATNMSITSNYICGPAMAANSHNQTPVLGNAKGFVSYETDPQRGTVVSGNTISANLTCASRETRSENSIQTKR